MTFETILLQLGGGFVRSVGLFFWTLLFSLPLGMLVSFGRMSRNPLIRVPVRIYIDIMRGTPLMLQLLIVYFGPYYLFGLNIGGFRYPAIVIGFSINYAAYFAEIFRSGIQSVPQGQREAAEVMGYSRTQTFRKIVLPQVIRIVLPSVTNETITLVKDTSLAYALAYSEMFSLAKQIAARETNFMPLVVAGVFYFIFNYVVAEIMNRIEKRMNYLE